VKRMQATCPCASRWRNGYVLQNYGLSTDFLLLGALALPGAFIVLLFGLETRRRMRAELSP